MGQHKTCANLRGKPLYQSNGRKWKVSTYLDSVVGAGVSGWFSRFMPLMRNFGLQLQTRQHQQPKQDKETIFIFHLSPFICQSVALYLAPKIVHILCCPIKNQCSFLTFCVFGCCCRTLAQSSSQLCFRLNFFNLEAKGDADLEVKIYRKILWSVTSFVSLHFFVRLE